MRFFLCALFWPLVLFAQGPEWLVVSPEGKAEAGQSFELLLAAPNDEAMPEEINVRVKAELAEFLVTLKAQTAAQNRRRIYAGTMPAAAGAGPATLQLAERDSNAIVLLVSRHNGVQRLTERTGATEEALLSEEDPVYFVLGPREGWNARFQLSFKYRLFDPGSGFGAERPWLSGLYFGYTQNSHWDLQSESKPFRDTSYRPSLYWKWQRTDDRTWIDAARWGVEHESNGNQGERSRSINIAFLRPEWRWPTRGVSGLEFTPKIYYYLSKGENPDIQRYRGYVDWRLRYDAGGQWITTSVVRVGTAGKGSFLIDASRRTRDMKVGPLSGYLHLQFFNGYGEDIVDYNVRHKAQVRIGLAIVP